MKSKAKVIKGLETKEIRKIYVEITCPLCENKTVRERHPIYRYDPYSCLFCGVMFKIVEWEESD